MNALQQYIDKASTLIEAMPYIQAFRGKIVVVKYGGSTMGGSGETDTRCGTHRVRQVVEQLVEVLPERVDRLTLEPKPRVAEGDDR